MTIFLVDMLYEICDLTTLIKSLILRLLLSSLIHKKFQRRLSTYN